MTALEEIRYRVQKQYRTNPKIHINVSTKLWKTAVENQEARIIGVYPNIFRVEVQGKGYTLQYADLLTKDIRIREVEIGKE